MQSPFNDFPKHGGLYLPGAAGSPSTGETIKSLVQTDTVWTNAETSTTTTVPFLNAVPTNTDGAQFLSIVFKPLRAGNLLRIRALMQFAKSGAVPYSAHAALFVNNEVNARQVMAYTGSVNGGLHPIDLTYEMPAGTTSPITFAVRAGANVAGTLSLNVNGAGMLGDSIRSFITVDEFETFSGARS